MSSRREFITLLGGAAASSLPWPRVTRAQQPKMPVIGFLDSGSPAGMESNLAAFRSGLNENGYTEGRDLAIEYRWAQERYDQLPALAADLVRRQVAVIAATRGPAPARAAKAATAMIPIVFQLGTDPVKDGIIASMNRPGDNVTGVSRLSTVLIPKRLGLLHEVVPKATTIAFLTNPNSPIAEDNWKNMEAAADILRQKVIVLKASSESSLDAAFAGLIDHRADALIVDFDPVFFSRREQIVTLAARREVPAIYAFREFAAAGGLMTYDASFSDSFRQVGVYVGRILKGAKPADLPVQQPVKFEFVINLKTAKALNLTIPPGVLAIADEVIE